MYIIRIQIKVTKIIQVLIIIFNWYESFEMTKFIFRIYPFCEMLISHHLYTVYTVNAEVLSDASTCQHAHHKVCYPKCKGSHPRWVFTSIVLVLFYLGEYLLQSYISNNVSVNEIPIKMKVKLNEFRMQGHDDSFY